MRAFKYYVSLCLQIPDFEGILFRLIKGPGLSFGPFQLRFYASDLIFFFAFGHPNPIDVFGLKSNKIFKKVFFNTLLS